MNDPQTRLSRRLGTFDAVVAGSALLAAGPQTLAGAAAPIDAAVRTGSFA